MPEGPVGGLSGGCEAGEEGGDGGGNGGEEEDDYWEGGGDEYEYDIGADVMVMDIDKDPVDHTRGALVLVQVRPSQLELMEVIRGI